MRSKQNLLQIPLLLTVGILLIIRAEAVADGVRRGLQLCMQTVIPSLFAFMVFCDLLAHADEKPMRLLFAPFRRLARLYRLPESAAPALCLGVLGGYPIGARMAASLKKSGRLSSDGAELLLCVAYGCSPTFLTGIGRLVFGSTKAGLILWVCQLLAIFPTGLLLRRRLPASSAEPVGSAEDASSFSDRFVAAVLSATRGMGVICGFVLAFSVVNTLLSAVPGGELLAALCEVSVGCSEASRYPFLPALVCVSACCSLGGVSVWMQNACFLRGSRVSMQRFFLSRAIHLPLSVLLSLLAERLFRLSEMGSAPVFSSFSSALPSMAAGSWLSSAFLVVCCLLLLIGRQEV